MIVLCLAYCIPFAKLFYFAFGFLLFFFSLFVLKRGIYRARPKLRQAAFFMMFLASLKLFVGDFVFGRRYFLCDYLPVVADDVGDRYCDGYYLLRMALGGLALFLFSAFLLFIFYQKYSRVGKIQTKTPEEVNLRLWANISLFCVIAMIVWLAAPWVAYLTVGSVARIFTDISWHDFALANAALLVIGFWKAESVNWSFQADKKDRKQYHHKVWTARDTLWMNVFLYLIALAFSYASSDVLK